MLVVSMTMAVALASRASAERASDPASVAAGMLDLGRSYSCAVPADGGARCWGYGAQGQLGYGNKGSVGADQTPAAAGPVDMGNGGTVQAISAGDFHACALVSGGSVMCWGLGANGRLGYGNTNNVGDGSSPNPNSPDPSVASAGPVDLGAGYAAQAITAGGAHTCVIRNDGRVVCWGYGFYGQLGYDNASSVGDGGTTFSGDPANQSAASVGPVNLGAGHTAAAISAGYEHTCAILNDGTVRCWGNGLNGQLGYGRTGNVGDGCGQPPSNTPSAGPPCPVAPGEPPKTPDPGVASVGPVDLGGHTAVAVSAGRLHTCVIRNDGNVVCWGYGGDGRLGYGNSVSVGDGGSDPSVASAGPVDLGGHTAVAISAGDTHTCAILEDGTVRCWGYGANGQLGYGNTSNVGDGIGSDGSPDPSVASAGPVDLGGHTAVAISAGATHTCAMLDDGSVRCWGQGAFGQLGYCNISNVGDTPADTPGSAGPVNLVSGDGGELCLSPVPANLTPPTIAGHAALRQTLTEAHGTWSPTPTTYAYQWERCDRTGAGCGTITGATSSSYTLAADDVGATIRVLETARDARGSGISATSAHTAVVTAPATVAPSDAARARGYRHCLAGVSAHARRARALTHRGSARARTRARRRLARELARGRRRCLRVYGRTPGPVTDLRAVVRGATKLELDFTAPGTDGTKGPGAHSYLIKQSQHPIRNQRNFAAAQALCKGDCRFAVKAVGTKISLMVTALRPKTTYYYAISARDNVTARPGPRTQAVHAKTG
jgi:alpha-tubulin suppressor-like RCC1 family protein